MSHFLQPHEPQYAMLHCPSLPPSLFKLMSIESVMPANHLILSSPSLPALNLYQHQGFFQPVSCSHQVAEVLELQHQPLK